MSEKKKKTLLFVSDTNALTLRNHEMYPKMIVERKKKKKRRSAVLMLYNGYKYNVHVLVYEHKQSLCQCQGCETYGSQAKTGPPKTPIWPTR